MEYFEVGRNNKRIIIVVVIIIKTIIQKNNTENVVPEYKIVLKLLTLNC